MFTDLLFIKTAFLSPLQMRSKYLKRPGAKLKATVHRITAEVIL